MQEIGDNAPGADDWDMRRHPSVVPQRRSIALAAATVAFVVAGVGAVALVVTRGDNSPTPTLATVPPAVSMTTTPTTVGPIPSTSTYPTSSLPASPPLPTSPQPTGVSYREPPPSLDLVTFAAVELPPSPENPAALPPVAALAGDRAVIVDQDGQQLIVVEEGGQQRLVPLALDSVTTVPSLFLVTAGPGDVIYGITPAPTTDLTRAAIVAIPVSGEQAGTVVASSELSINAYTEAAATLLGPGPTGIIDRRSGEQLLAYVDANGDAAAPIENAPIYSLDPADESIIQDSDGNPRWQLNIERDPAYTGGYTSDPPPAALDTGRALYATAVGAPLEPSADYSNPSMPVVALLNADGTGSWYSIRDDWQLAASGLNGVIFTRRVGNTIELARPSESTPETCPNPPMFHATTLPEGFSKELIPGEGGQITIGPNGEAIPIEPVNREVHHYADQPGLFIDIYNGARPGTTGTTSQPVNILGTTGTLTDIEDGLKAEFALACGTYTIISSGVTKQDFIGVLEGLALDE